MSCCKSCPLNSWIWTANSNWLLPFFSVRVLSKFSDTEEDWTCLFHTTENDYRKVIDNLDSNTTFDRLEFQLKAANTFCKKIWEDRAHLEHLCAVDSRFGIFEGVLDRCSIQSEATRGCELRRFQSDHLPRLRSEDLLTEATFLILAGYQSSASCEAQAKRHL